MIIGVYGIYIENKKVLMVRTKEGYDVFPGGEKRTFDEPDEVCLKREISGEIGGVKILMGLHYKNFKGHMPNSNNVLYSITYFFCPEEKLREVSGEITESKFVDSSDEKRLNLTNVSKKTLDSLIKQKLIK
jgi:8-oxo-dGTP pyrophosphatase MutT (NUDIX family)